MKLSGPEISTCPTCGTALEEISNGDLGCMVCLLRAGLSDENQVTEDRLWDADNQFGVYVIERQEDGSLHELGRGAMGVTYRAVDTSLQRKVALKIIKTDRAGGAEARERFMREARMAATLRHPNVATVYQFGIREESGQCFYAMELIEGETLEERVRRTGPINPTTVIAIAQQVTAALAAAEKNGLVHRDLKPANLMLIAPDKPGEEKKLIVKVIDFGLARAVKSETDPMSLTRGGFVGTPSFASPEQFGNAPIDVRSDIYSLGVTLWFALTGKTPFPGRNVEEIRDAQQSNSLSIQPLKAARVPTRLIELLKSMLAIEPAARPGTTALATRLADCAASRSSLGQPLIYAVVSVLVLALIFVWSVNRSASVQEVGGTSNSAARESYLKGLYIWSKRNYPEYPQAEQYFKQAIDLDPIYAQAYAGLGNVLQFMGSDRQKREQHYSDSTAATHKALELEPRLADAHASLGLIAMNYDWDWPAADREFRRALELDPTSATAHHWYAEYLATQGRFEDSLRQIERARQLNPTSFVIPSDNGKILVFAHRFEEAEKKLKEALTLDGAWGTRFWLAFSYAHQKQFPRAFAEVQKMERGNPDVWTSGLAAYIYGLANDRVQAEKMLAETQQRLGPTDDYLPLVYAYIGTGDKEQALSYLERDCQTRSVSMTSLRVAPLYDSLRSDPRFADLLQRVHLAPSSSQLNVGTSNLAAREAYLKGLYIWNSRHGERYQDAEQYFRQAIALDANYAEAYAGLSNLLQFMADHPLQREKRYAEAIASARRSVALNPSLPEAHAALGLIAMNYEWDWAKAEQEFRHSIQLNPDYSTGHHWLAEYLGAQRRFDESLREMKRARELNPTLPVIHHDIGKILLFAGRFGEAEAELKETIALDPSQDSALFWLAQTYAKAGRFSEALTVAAQVERNGDNAWSSGLSAYINGLAGDIAQARQFLAKTKKRMTPESDELPLVYAYVGVGDIDHALTYLEHDCATHSTSMTSLLSAPLYDSLRSNPRFVDLLHRVHLAP